jgi:phosphatidylglycerol---prolipoprotein diacylglyceryl transferase
MGLIPFLPDYIHSYKVFGILPIQPFGVLVGIALVVGYMLGRRRARLVGLDPQLCADGMVWTVVVGFIVAHMVSVIFYFPGRLAERPWALLEVWAGLSSFGGFVGAIIGANWFFRKHKAPVMKYVDAIVFGFVPAWIIGRAGCTVVHDHPGRATDFFLAVNAPGGPEHDLGLYEMLFAVVLTVVIYALKRVRPFDGFHPALMLILYSPVRFLLDFLRKDDKTYFGFTPGQYASVVMLALAAWLIIRGLRQRRAEQEQPARRTQRSQRGLKTA